MPKELIVKNCPLCGNTHKYQLRIIRDITGAGKDKEINPTSEIIEKLLICPKINQPFKYSIEIPRPRSPLVKQVLIDYIGEG